MVGIGEFCGPDRAQCADGSFCDRSVGPGEPECEERGECTAIAKACEEPPGLRCGCDGQVYESACEAAMAGVATREAEACEPPTGMFPCGPEYCALETQYCRHTVGGGVREQWSCVNLTCTGASTGCDCLDPDDPCGNDTWYPGHACEIDKSGGPTLWCLLP
mgnify:CR=1 FL=1